jgi:hypothetical protein
MLTSKPQSTLAGGAREAKTQFQTRLSTRSKETGACGGFSSAVKLWLAILWALPMEFSVQAIPLMFVSFFLSGLSQILWRSLKKQSTTNSLTPAAWRTIPYTVTSPVSGLHG